MNSVLKRIAECGQSIWYDNIRRGMIASGELQRLIDDGVVGVTSNPTIFQKAIGESGDYDEALREMAVGDLRADEIYDTLAVQDIQAACDLFLPVYERMDRRDGFVSIEVNPHLAHDTRRTVAEARRLHAAVGRPNVMIKIPGTEEGLPAIQTALGEGINVNVTLIFGVDVYARIMEAYMAGVETFVESGGDAAGLASVASFFVSRVDTLVDGVLANKGDEAQPLLGKAAVANSKLAYERYQQVFAGERFAALRAKGARVQRPLWASTSTKNPSYSPTMYVDSLIGLDTVNTMPQVTLDAVRGGMDVAETVTKQVDQARRVIDQLAARGILIDEVTNDLRIAGVKAFADSYDKLLADVEAKRQGIAAA